MPHKKIADKLYSWASLLEENTKEQAEAISKLPIIHGHVALMPDAHLGKGSTVGSVIPTERAVIPAAIGVDIGCGMGAVKTNLSSYDLPDDLNYFVESLREVIPAGLGKWHREPDPMAYKWWNYFKQFAPELAIQTEKQTLSQLGTLGSGNHFLELVLDEDDVVWVFLHSGSRGIGNKIANEHMKIAKKYCHYEFKAIRGVTEDRDLAWLEEDSPEFKKYIDDMHWAQSYAMQNREVMMTNAIKHLFYWITHTEDHRASKAPKEIQRINCHHNFTQQESWNGKNVWVTRKGAIEADQGRLGLIPGSMGAKSYVVRGLGNELSWNSCSHGAGRRMSRKQARRELTVDDLNIKMQGKAWLNKSGKELLDEHPDSYKDIDVVMHDQSDLVEIVHTFNSIVNYKGVS